MSLCFVAGATGTMWGIKSHRILPMFIAGIGVGMTLLADARGIVWALPWLCGLLFVIFLEGRYSTKRCVLSLSLFHSTSVTNGHPVSTSLMPLGLSPRSTSDPLCTTGSKFTLHRTNIQPIFTWGMAPLSDLPQTIHFLWEQTKLVVPPSDRDAGLELGRAIAKFYWEWAILGLVVTVLWFARRPWTLFAILISVSPFVMTFHGALTMLEEHIRFYIQTLPGIIILWAILWEQGVTLSDHLIHRISQSWYRWIQVPVRFGLMWFLPLYLLSNLVLGSIDSPLSPTADWRRDWDPQPSDFGDIVSNYKDGRMMEFNSIEPCGRGIQKVEKMQKPLETTIYDGGLQQHLDVVLNSAFGESSHSQ